MKERQEGEKTASTSSELRPLQHCFLDVFSCLVDSNTHLRRQHSIALGFCFFSDCLEPKQAWATYGPGSTRSPFSFVNLDRPTWCKLRLQGALQAPPLPASIMDGQTSGPVEVKPVQRCSCWAAGGSSPSLPPISPAL